MDLQGGGDGHNDDAVLAAALQAQEMELLQQERADGEQRPQPSPPARRQPENIPAKAMALKSSIAWHVSVDLVHSCVLLVLLSAESTGLSKVLGSVAVLSPVAGLLAVRHPDWRLALAHGILSTGGFAIRTALPSTSSNFLISASSVALAFPAFHHAFLAVQRLAFLWSHRKASSSARTRASSRTGRPTGGRQRPTGARGRSASDADGIVLGDVRSTRRYADETRRSPIAERL